jgi:hypothetical protein
MYQSIGFDRNTVSQSWAKYSASKLPMYHALHVGKFGWSRVGFYFYYKYARLEGVIEENFSCD